MLPLKAGKSTYEWLYEAIRALQTAHDSLCNGVPAGEDITEFDCRAAMTDLDIIERHCSNIRWNLECKEALCRAEKDEQKARELLCDEISWVWSGE